MRYSVKMDSGQDYIVDVERLTQQMEGSDSEKENEASITMAQKAEDDESNNYSKIISYEAVKSEYEHCIQRSEKLDNKIYIMLTVYAFIFALLTSLISQIREFAFPTDAAQLALIIIFLSLLIIDLLIYFMSLTKMVGLLKGVELKRFTAGSVIDNDLMSLPEIPVTRYVAAQYTECINVNNDVLEKRYKKFNENVYAIVAVLAISIAIAIIANFTCIS